MRGFIYLTKEFNSDGIELLHNGLPKIGIGKTNDLDRRFWEHHNRGSKSTTYIDFIETFQVDNMDKIEKDLHRTLKSLGYGVVNRTSGFDENKLDSKTEVFSGKHIDTSQEISPKLIVQILESLVSGTEYIKITRQEFVPHFLQEIAILQCLDAIEDSESSDVNIISELCARFGKTLTYLELFRRLENDIMILPSYMHSVFTSFEKEIIGKYADEKIGKWSNFQNFKIIDTRSTNNWQEKFVNNLGTSKLVIFVSVQTPQESFSKFDIIKEIDSKRKFVVIDEADLGAHTQNSQKVIDYII
jgi:predicted GIY-YIG superfamily endonuclease